jgi:hypothetical protein
MYVKVAMTDSGDPTGELCEASDLKRFSVRVGAGCHAEAVANWLAEADAGRPVGEDVAINVRWLRQRTAEHPAEWQEGFQKMLDYAATRGWMDEARTVVMAHVETM